MCFYLKPFRKDDWRPINWIRESVILVVQISDNVRAMIVCRWGPKAMQLRVVVLAFPLVVVVVEICLKEEEQ